MRTSREPTGRKPAGRASRLLERPGQARAAVARQGRLVELVRETNRRLRRASSPRAV